MSDLSPRAVLYLRISDDPTGLAAGVDRQRTDGLRLADREGLDVVGEYVDNDRSAYSGKPRPAFEQLLAEASHGVFEVVIVWASDRLYRRVADLTRIADQLAPHARIAAVMGGGDIDLTTAEGILRAQVLGSVAEFESRRKAERVHGRAVQRAKGDRKMTATTRPVGWAWADPCPAGPDCRHPRPCTAPGVRPRPGSRAGLVVNPTEAAVLAAAYQAIADGASLKTATKMFTASGLPTRKGGRWSSTTVRNALTNPRNAGLVAHRGEVVAEAADGLQIVPVALWQRVQGILTDPERRTAPGRPSGTPLSGIARCGKCGGPMNASNKWEKGGRKRPVYLCAREQHVSRSRPLIDEPVLALVRAWLTRHAATLADRAQPGAGPVQLAAAGVVAALTERLAALSELVASGALDPVDYAAAAAGVRTRLVVARSRATVTAGRPATSRLLTAGPDLGAAFDVLVAEEDPAGLRAVLTEVLIGVVVVPGRTGLDGLRVEWAEWATPDVEVV